MKTFSKFKYTLWMMAGISFIGCTAKVELDISKSGSPNGSNFGASSGGSNQSGPKSVTAVKIVNQRQLVESLINTLGIQANRTAVMALWEALKPQLPLNGNGSELSTAALTATTQLVTQACFFVSVASPGLPTPPSAGMAPSSAQVKSIADYFSRLFLNRPVTDSELLDLQNLVPEVYISTTLNDAAKFKRLVDMTCTVIGTSAEALMI